MTVKDRQSLFDIAIIATGSVESVVEIARLNSVGLDHVFELGSDVIVPAVVNAEIVNFINNKGIVPVSGQEQILPAQVGEIRNANFGDVTQGWIQTISEWVSIDTYALLWLLLRTTTGFQSTDTEFQLPQYENSKIFIGNENSTCEYPNVNINRNLSNEFQIAIGKCALVELDSANLSSDLLNLKNFKGDVDFRYNNFDNVRFVSNELRRIVLRNNNIVSATNLEMYNCEELYLHYNNITEFSYTHLDELRVLNVSSNNLTSIDCTGLQNVENLQCWSNNINDIDISYMTKISFLDIHNNNLTATTNSQVLIELDSNGVLNGFLKTSSVSGSLTAAAVAAKTNLLSKGWSIIGV